MTNPVHDALEASAQQKREAEGVQHEYRDECFETTHGLRTLVRVNNTTRMGFLVTLTTERMGQMLAAHLTPDEALQLADMLRLAARGLGRRAGGDAGIVGSRREG